MDVSTWEKSNLSTTLVKKKIKYQYMKNDNLSTNL